MTESKTPIISIDGQSLKKLVEVSLTWLKVNHQYVNSLNVFPVPDGDTGTNMLLTMQAAYAEVVNSEETNIGKMAKDIAQGALMGARGNSGVILSQIWRGFARALDSLPEMDAVLLSKALIESKNTAYKGVVRPVEGTILTVIKDISLSVENSVQQTNDLPQILEDAVNAANISVRHTPELLPILKTAGVVDSGGKGLFFLLEGMLRHINGISLESSLSTQPIELMNTDQTLDAVEEGQDVEVVIDFTPEKSIDLESFYEDLSKIGTSVQLGEGDGMYRLHIHVENEKQNEPLAYISNIGSWSKVAMENLQLQMAESRKKPLGYTLNEFVPNSIAVVVVSPGTGISKIFASLGVAAIVEGGQTMNPSTEEILSSFENLPTNQVIILPNNKNIVLAANASTSISVKNVVVIPSLNVPQGLSALLRLDPEGDFGQVVSDMTEAISEVDTCEVTTATRTVEINKIEIEAGKLIGLLNGKIEVSADTVLDTVLALLNKADMSSRERITLFYGNNITLDEVNKICADIAKAFPHHEIEVHEGGQPHYHFIISLE